MDSAVGSITPAVSSEDARERLRALAASPLSKEWRRFDVAERLHRPQQVLLAAYRRLAASARGGRESSAAGEWLLDNYYVIERAVRLVEEQFPIEFSRRLPQPAAGEFQGQAVVYAVACEIVALTEYRIDIDALASTLAEIQSVRPLCIAEVWALPLLLRVVLIERLAEVAPAIGVLSQKPETPGPAAKRDAVPLDRLVASCIQSLRALEAADWNAFFERVSVIERTLREDPAAIYARMDFDTRDRYRKAVEELAAFSATSEATIAAKAVRLASEAQGGRAAHVGYYLVDGGFESLASAVGYHPKLWTRFRRQLKRHPTAFYLGGIGTTGLLQEVGLCAALLLLGATASTAALAVILAAVPATTVAVSLVNAILTRIMMPSPLPKMDFSEGVPSEWRTMVVVPVILAGIEDVAALVDRLEIHWLANADAALDLALLTDFADAPRQSMPGDSELLQRARDGIEALNIRYGDGKTGPFHLLHRDRKWNPAEGCWMGWERKRGKLAELNRLLRGDETTSFSLHVGDPGALRSIRFVITLDADTELPRGSARRLIATLAHPLNRAEIDEASGRVTAGYTILQPRVDVAPQSAQLSQFVRLFAGDAGLDLYSRAISDVYQDVFGEGIYVGKGIYDPDTFERSLQDRIPENAVLSHDLLEGLHGRVGLVSDISLLEEHPSDYLAHARRLHRWARGDWQLLPWLARRVPLAAGGYTSNRLSAIARWKILDNLRRTLLPPALLAFLIVSWLWFPGAPVVWTLLTVLVLAAPALTEAVGGLLVTARRGDFSPALVGVAASLRSGVALWLLHIAFLPHRAAVVSDAVVRTLVRMAVTRRGLLQWVPAAQTNGLRDGTLRQHTWLEMASGPAAAIGIGVLLSVAHSSPAVALPMLLAWLLSPEIALRVSRLPVRSRPQLTDDERNRLRRLARRTWLFFETFVGPDDQWLAPDHFQEDPRRELARRTSPTNIGLLQLATVAAYDFGYLGLLSLVLRLRNSMDTLQRMERHSGHFYNWYDTRNLAPLEPRYVSTVDSGNLAACLLAVKQSCLQLQHVPIVSAMQWQGLLDALAVLDEVVQRGVRTHGHRRFKDLQRCIEAMRRRARQLHHLPAAAWAPALEEILTQGCPEFDRGLLDLVESRIEGLDATLLTELRIWSDNVHRQIQAMSQEIQICLPWHSHPTTRPDLLDTGDIAAAWAAVAACLPANPTLRELCDVASATAKRLTDLDARLATMTDDAGVGARRWVGQLADAIARASEMARGVTDTLTRLADTAAVLVREMDFAGLYNPQRRLLHLGYNVSANAMDQHHYDLLASEARLASFVAIAKGDVPVEHWLHLGRPMGRVAGGRVLLSWSATMFEYLMPTLLMREEPDTVLGQSCLAVVHEQIAYARRRAVPWGISEASYYFFDAHQNYQYRAFGIPNLGFKRGLEDDLVVAPYASLLAVRFEPQAVVKNLDELEKLGLLGAYGFYEAIDFTRSRLPPQTEHALVRSFMAHHQGMILGALGNLLNDDVLVRRFHAEPMVRTVEPLLFERRPSGLPVERTRPEPLVATTPVRRRPAMEAWSIPLDAPFPQAHILSNGSYHLLMTDGGSAANWNDVALTRWRADTTLDASGLRVYLRDLDRNEVWSLPASADDRRLVYHPHLVEHAARAHGIAAHERIAVAPDDDVEIRLLSLTNEEASARRLQVTTYAEVVLGDAAEDRRHPTFTSLFVESEYLNDLDALIFRRRPRDTHAPQAWLVHTLVRPQEHAQLIGYESARDRFWGRVRGAPLPAALAIDARDRSGTGGATLDPIMSLTAEVEIPPHQTVTLACLVMVAESRDAALQLARRHSSLADLEWQLELARRRAETELARLDLEPRRFPALQTILSLLLYPHHGLRAAPAILAGNQGAQAALWQHGISGDLPILLLRVNETEDPSLLHTLLQGHRLWRSGGVRVDFAILNERPTGYEDELDAHVMRNIVNAGAASLLRQPGGVFLIHADRMTAVDRDALLASARVVVQAGAGDLEAQLAHVSVEPARLPPLVPTLAGPVASKPLSRPTDLVFDNGFGGFSADGREYIVHLEPGEATPAPWVNVIANPHFGFIVSESGGGYTWAENSGENRLTPWRSDPVGDIPGDAIYLRDEETGNVWSPTPLPAPSAAAYQCRHGAGFTAFRHCSEGIDQELRLYVPWDDPVKIVRLRLTNQSDRMRRITATYYVEWVLGVAREQSQMFVVPEFDPQSEAILVRNPWNPDFANRVSFVASSKKLHGVTGDRTEFLGRRGSYAHPVAMRRIGLASAVTPGLDPCAALQVHLDLAPDASTEIHFLLGQATGRDAALDLVRTYREAAVVDAKWDDLHKRWDETLSTLTVRTPDPAIDLMANRWLLYQTLASRLWGRTGYYQSGGAFGFRDQLQDVSALVPVRPDLCRAHILEAARHQFAEGDVLHWWHPPSGAGVRTRCSDDLLWLPFVTTHYIAATGDDGILGEEVRFLSGASLLPNQLESYARFAPGERRGTLYEHCCAAIEHAQTVGRHGLPLFGNGDWNDGMNRVGAQGRGESVWLGWFLYATLTRFAPVCQRRGDRDRAERFRESADKLRQALAACAWDGEWYRRGYYDDGRPLGSAQNSECRIDSVAQSWAVLSSAADPQRARAAIESACRLLASEEDGLICLLSPPFDGTSEDAGYISAYPPGIRENGGQYTHAAIWVVWALAVLGDGDRAATLFRRLLPIEHALDRAEAARYRVEPYVIAADVYSVEPHRGRGGWTWYTGSAGWAYRFVIEALLGLRAEPGGWRLDPCIPRAWPGFEIELRDGATMYRIAVENPFGVSRGIGQVVYDGRSLTDNRIERINDGGSHEVRLRLGTGSEVGPPTRVGPASQPSAREPR